MPFRTEIPIRFGDEDHAGLVYFPRFFHFFHCAFEDFFNQQGTTYKEVLDGDRTGWPAVHIESDFDKPLRFGDTLVVEVRVKRVGTKSAVFVYDGFDKASGERVSHAEITVACIDMTTFRAKPIPDKYRALFEKHLAPAP